MQKGTVWNAFLAALMTASFAVIGWLTLSVIKLQNQYAAETAEKQLRQDITDVMNDVDKRLAIIEALMLRGAMREQQLLDPEVPEAPAPPDPDEAAPEPLPQLPRYDLREQRAQRPLEDN